VLTGAARKLGVAITGDGAAEIAARSGGRRASPAGCSGGFATSPPLKGPSASTRALAARSLARLEVDEQGLDSLDRRYLRALIENYGGGPAGMDTLAAAIAESRDAVEDVIEPYLLQQGFIPRTPRGRTACSQGLRPSRIKPAARSARAANPLRGLGKVRVRSGSA
jgi:Holliday junction DNA helicase RuvB